MADPKVPGSSVTVSAGSLWPRRMGGCETGARPIGETRLLPQPRVGGDHALGEHRQAVAVQVAAPSAMCHEVHAVAFGGPGVVGVPLDRVGVVGVVFTPVVPGGWCTANGTLTARAAGTGISGVRG